MGESQKGPVKKMGPVWTGGGYVEAAVWAHSNDNRVWYSVTTRKRYKAEGNWKESQSLYDSDLLPLARLLECAWEWIATQARDEGEKSGSR